MLVVLMLFPIVVLELRFLSPLISGLNRVGGDVHRQRHKRCPARVAVHADNNRGDELVAAATKGRRQVDNPGGYRVADCALCSGNRCTVVPAVRRKERFRRSKDPLTEQDKAS